MSRKRKLLTITSILIIGSLLLVIITAWIASGQIVSPTRRPLQDYHQTILNNPEKYGIQIHSSISSQTNCPYLVVEPHGAISDRGRIIRGQLDTKQLLPFGSIVGNIVLFHGRRGRKEDLLSVAERFCAVGFRCILVDLPAHGDHSKSFAHYGAHADDGLIAKKVLDDASDQYKLQTLPNHLWGMSMGGAYANKTLLETQDFWKSAVIVCSFDSLHNVIDDNLSALPKVIKTPYSYLIHRLVKARSGFDYHNSQPKLWTVNTSTPVMIVHGTADELISLNQGKALYDSYNSPEKRWVEVPDGGHDNILITPMPLYAKMAEWFLTNQKL